MEEKLKNLQPRQLEWLYWLAVGENKYGASLKMRLSFNSISQRQINIRYKLGLNKYFSLKKIAEEHSEWIIQNAKVRGRR